MADQEYYAFLNWLKSQSQDMTFLAPGPNNYRNSMLYKAWVKANKPSAETLPGTFGTEVEPSVSPRVPEVISIGGWDFMPAYDEQGNITGYAPLDKTGTTAADKAATQAEAIRQFNEQMGLSREQFGFQQAQAGLAAQKEQAQLRSAVEQRRAAELYGALAPKSEGMSARERAQIYEQVRNDVLGGITSPRNWIQYLQVKNAPNPYAPKEVDMESQYNTLTEEVKRATSAADIVRGRLKDLNDPLTPSALANPQGTEEQLAALALKNESNLKGKLLEFQIARGQGITNAGNLAPGWQANVLAQSEARDIAQQQAWAMPKPTGMGGNMVITGEPEMPTQPTGTSIPDWMRVYVPGFQGKQFLEEAPKAEITRPSAQSWMRLPETQAQMLAGYADFSGQDWNEMLRQMALERPKAAPVPSRSSAFRQR